jgi:hypothetical protein
VKDAQGRLEPAEWRVESLPFPRQWIEPAVALFQRQAARFRADAAEIEVAIERLGTD